jgi:hypothetical protein
MVLLRAHYTDMPDSTHLWLDCRLLDVLSHDKVIVRTTNGEVWGLMRTVIDRLHMGGDKAKQQLRRRRKALANQIRAVDTSGLYQAMMDGNSDSAAAWGVFCTDCLEYACLGAALYRTPIPVMLDGAVPSELSQPILDAMAGVEV